MNQQGVSRRTFLTSGVGAVAAATLAPPIARAEGGCESAGNTGRIYKAVKWGMISYGETVLEKFELCRELGYDGMELEAPSRHDAAPVREASLATDMPVHGTVDHKHWQVRLSSPDEATGVEASLACSTAWPTATNRREIRQHLRPLHGVL